MVKLPSNINILQPSKNSEATRSRQRCCSSRHNARNWWEKTWKRWIGRRQNGLRRCLWWTTGVLLDEQSGCSPKGYASCVNTGKWRYKQQGPVQKLPCWGYRINSGNRIINMDSHHNCCWPMWWGPWPQLSGDMLWWEVGMTGWPFILSIFPTPY